MRSVLMSLLLCLVGVGWVAMVLASALLQGCGEQWRVREVMELEPVTVCETPAQGPSWLPADLIAVAQLASAQPATGDIGVTGGDEDMRVAVAEVPEGRPDLEDAPSASPLQACVDLNTATLEMLVTLPGVGPARAAQIVEARARRPFEKPRHITRIRGIGPATYHKMKDMLCES